MIWRTAMAVLIGVFFLGFWGPIKTAPAPQKLEEKTRMTDVSPELREKAFALLREIVKETENLKLPQNRTELKIRAADLLWEKDEKEARKIFLEAQGELAKMSLQVEEECGYNESALFTRCMVSDLQSSFIEALAGRDAKSADAALHYFSDEPDENLEMVIFKAYLKSDPQKAFEIAQKDIKKRNLPFYLGNTPMFGDGSPGEISSDIYGKLTGLYLADQNLGAKLAREILENIKTKKIAVSSPVLKMPMLNKGMSNAATAVNSYKGSANSNNAYWRANISMKSSANNTPSNVNFRMPPETNELDFSQASSFLHQAEALNKQKKVPALTESEMKELASLITRSLISKRSFEYYQVRNVYPLINKYVPDQIQKLRRQMTPAEWKKFEVEMRQPEYEFAARRKLGDILREAEGASAEKRDELYAEASVEAQNSNQCDGLESGFYYFLKIEKKDAFPQLKETYADMLQKYKAVNGDAKELQKALAGEKDPVKKMELITQAATVSAQKGNIENSKKLLNDAQKFLPEKYKNLSQLRAYVIYAGALAGVDNDKSFLLFEGLAGQASQNINTVAEFYQFREETEHIINDEFLFESIELQSALYINPSVPIIKKLAQADLERTVKLADKFSRPEVRLFARWHIAESLLDKGAENKEAMLVMKNGLCEGSVGDYRK